MAKNSRMNSWTLLRILVVPCLFLCAIFKHRAFQWIACAALVIWVITLMVELIRPRLKMKKRERKMEPEKAEVAAPVAIPEPAETHDAQLSLLRQVNHRVTEQLKQNYPLVAWLWETRPTTEDISKGCTKRIKLYHCDPFNYGEVTMAESGKLEIALIQLVPLADAEQQPVVSTEDLEETDILDRSDVKNWYTDTGLALLSELIDELNVQGHKRLVIHKNGEVLVTASGKQEIVDTIPNFPPRIAWDDLCVLAREDDISVEVCNQELAVSWA